MRSGIGGFTLTPTFFPPCLLSPCLPVPCQLFLNNCRPHSFQALLSALYPIVSPALPPISLPALSPALFPTLSPTLSQTLSPTLSLTCVLLLRLQLFQGFTLSSLSACSPFCVFQYSTMSPTLSATLSLALSPTLSLACFRFVRNFCL